MTDQAQTTTPQPPAPPATQGEHMIPKSRLDEILEANRLLKEKLEATEKERNEQLEAQLKEQGRWKEIAEQRAQELAALKPKAEAVDAYEKTLQDVLASQIAEIPENMRGLIPDELPTQGKLQWLSKNKALLVKPKPLDIGAGKTGGQAAQSADLSPEEIQLAKQFGMSPEDYAKHKK